MRVVEERHLRRVGRLELDSLGARDFVFSANRIHGDVLLMRGQREKTSSYFVDHGSRGQYRIRTHEDDLDLEVDERGRDRRVWDERHPNPGLSQCVSYDAPLASGP